MLNVMMNGTPKAIAITISFIFCLDIMKLYNLLQISVIFSHCHIIKHIAKEQAITMKKILRNFPNVSYVSKVLWKLSYVSSE